MSISKFGASVASFNNDMTAALAHFKLDFTLIKVEPPKEYSALQTALSRVRREEAEDGKYHQTARKLGALFHNLIPQTPALIKAYGKRVSEIFQSQDASQQSASVSPGIFAEQVGIDATSIWAAATSGPPSIAIHLLACMIARMFTAAEATSLWHELVEQRKQQLTQDKEDGLADHTDSFASQFEITRMELSSWDASVRAWIQSADQAKSVQQSRLMSAIHDTRLPVKNEDTILESVKSVWTKALQAMENLINGIAQSAHSAEVLVGLSAWHIYPDLLVLSNSIKEPIKQQDHLVASGGLLTLGLQMDTQTDDDIFWSIPLTYLRYYGDPVISRGSIGLDNSRITSDELSLVMLGCIFRCWGTFGTNLLEAATWFPRILELLHTCLTENGGKDLELEDLLRDALSGESWVPILASASTRLLEADELEIRMYEKLVRLGRRRVEFLTEEMEKVPPLFGLSDPSRGIAVLIDSETRILLLRNVAKRLNLPVDAFIIAYKLEDKDFGISDVWEYATIGPLVSKGTVKRTRDGTLKDDTLRCARWSHRPTADGKVLDEEYFQLNTAFLSHVALSSLYLGNRYLAGIYPLKRCLITTGTSTETTPNPSDIDRLRGVRLSADDIRTLLTRGRLNIRRFLSLLACGVMYDGPDRYRLHPFQENLRTFASIIGIYKLLPGATISTRIFQKPLTLSCKLVHLGYTYPKSWFWPQSAEALQWAWPLERHHAFACVAYCETGSCELDCKDLKNVFALSSGNSIFVAGTLLSDPSECVPDRELRRLVGNIGRPGLALLIPPREPKIRKIPDGAWAMINHKPFDGVLEDCFEHTSLHLSFTDYVMPLSVQTHGDRDSNAYLIESIVSIHDRGQWIADIDILKMFERDDLEILEGDKDKTRVMRLGKDHAHHDKTDSSFGTTDPASSRCKLTMVDNWDELLEPPEGDFIARAYGNWSARLALAAMCRRLGHNVFILPGHICCADCYYDLSKQYVQIPDCVLIC